jgi:hypothetical protein
MVTDVLFVVHMLLGTSSSIGLFGIFWMSIFTVTLAIRQRRQGVWGVLRALSGVELGYRHVCNCLHVLAPFFLPVSAGHICAGNLCGHWA